MCFVVSRGVDIKVNFQTLAAQLTQHIIKFYQIKEDYLYTNNSRQRLSIVHCVCSSVWHHFIVHVYNFDGYDDCNENNTGI